MTEEAATRAKLLRLAAFLSEKNLLEGQIAELVGRPGERGHVGEFIASLIFDIRLHGSAHKGHFPSARQPKAKPDRGAPGPIPGLPG